MRGDQAWVSRKGQAAGGEDVPEKVDRVGVREVEVELGEHMSLGAKDLVVLVAAVGHEEEVGDRGAHDFLVLGGDEERGDSDELELDERDFLEREEAVDDVGREEDGFGEKAELGVDLDEPVDEDAPHLPRHLGVGEHVIGAGHRRELQGKPRSASCRRGLKRRAYLELAQVLVHFDDVGGDHERVVLIALVKVLPAGVFGLLVVVVGVLDVRVKVVALGRLCLLRLVLLDNKLRLLKLLLGFAKRLGLLLDDAASLDGSGAGSRRGARLDDDAPVRPSEGPRRLLETTGDGVGGRPGRVGALGAERADGDGDGDARGLGRRADDRLAHGLHDSAGCRGRNGCIIENHGVVVVVVVVLGGLVVVLFNLLLLLLLLALLNGGPSSRRPGPVAPWGRRRRASLRRALGVRGG